jgi:hypothetical protein
LLLHNEEDSTTFLFVVRLSLVKGKEIEK